MRAPKKLVHYYSDCSFFAGSENMLAGLLSSQELHEEFDLAFTYRANPVYQAGLSKRVKVSLPIYPVRLLSTERLRILKYVFWFVNVLRLWSHFRRLKIDLLHINNGGYPGAYSALSAVVAARLAGVKRVVFVVNNVARSYRSPGRWLDYGIDRLVCRGVSVFVTGSRFAGRALSEVLGRRQSLQVIPNGIEVQPARLSREAVRSLLGIPEGRPLVSMVALLVERKGHRYLLEAMARLNSQSCLAHLACMGSGPLHQTLRGYARDIGLHRHIVWIDDGDLRYKDLNQNRGVFSLLAASDLVVLPSIAEEDFPNVILEAMACGRPIVASDFSGIPEQITDGVEGLLVPPRDARALADAMARVLSDAELSRKLGAAALRRFDDQFTMAHAVRRYVGLYGQLVDSSGASVV